MLEVISRLRPRWYIIPGSGSVIVMGGFLTEDEVIQFVHKRLTSLESHEASYRLLRLAATIYFSQVGKSEPAKNLFDYRPGEDIIVHEGDADYVRTVNSPFWIEVGASRTLGYMEVKEVSSGTITCYRVDPYGRNDVRAKIFKEVLDTNTGDSMASAT